MWCPAHRRGDSAEGDHHLRELVGYGEHVEIDAIELGAAVKEELHKCRFVPHQRVLQAPREHLVRLPMIELIKVRQEVQLGHSPEVPPNRKCQ